MPVIKNVTIDEAKRLHNSVNGNPRFNVTLSNGAVYMTQSDASCSYEVENYLHNHKLADVTLTRALRISYIRDAQEG